jgi:glycosyltransferase involved in cell wall biosynthesis
LKIIRITPYLDFGGVERRIESTAIGFLKYSSIELNIIALGNEGITSRKLQSLSFSPVHLNQKINIPNIFLIFHLFKLLKSIKPKIVHTSAAEANFHGLIAAKLAGVPVRIGEEIGFPNHDWKWRLIFKWVYKSATKVIAISQAVKDRVVELGEVEMEKVEVVYNPVEIGRDSLDFSLRSSVPRHCRQEYDKDNPLSFNEADSGGNQSDNNKPFVFVTTCRLVPVKNLDTLIKVFYELVKKHQDRVLKLWIVGNGPEREDLESLVEKLWIQNYVFFLGFQEDVVPFLEQADTFVLPSFSEGFSISLVEAMLCGLPCIVTNQGGPSEIVEDDKTGFLINPKDPDQLKEKMEEVLAMSEEARELMGKRAQEAGGKYSVENYVKRLMEVYTTP